MSRCGDGCLSLFEVASRLSKESCEQYVIVNFGEFIISSASFEVFDPEPLGEVVCCIGNDRRTLRGTGALRLIFGETRGETRC